MANTATLSIKTDLKTKSLIQAAADNIGLSVNAFILMVARNAAKSDKIVIDNDLEDEALYDAEIAEAEKYNARHKSRKTWEELKQEYGV
jgi:antitoxin component of RelBE/YafQ-DinJ toxin-antitoxin module